MYGIKRPYVFCSFVSSLTLSDHMCFVSSLTLSDHMCFVSSLN